MLKEGHLASGNALRVSELSTARRRAGVVAAIAGLILVPCFLLAGTVASMPVDEAPPVGAPAAEFVDFYVENFSSMPKLGDNLDPGVAQAMVLSRDGLHAVAIVLLGLSMFTVAWLLARSEVWGHWPLAVIGAMAAIPAAAQVIAGSEGLGPGLIMVWGIVVAVVVVIGLRRSTLLPPASTPEPRDS